MTQIAAGSNTIDDDWEPSKIHLSIPLMWDVLQINCRHDSQSPDSSLSSNGGGLLHPSLTPPVTQDSLEEGPASTLEVIVAMSPEVTVNTADGGLAAHMPPQTSTPSSASVSPASTSMPQDKLLAPADSLMLNTPWLWADPAQFVDTENMGFNESESSLPNLEGFSTWWDFGNL